MDLKDALSDLLWGSRCPVCDVGASAVCADCRELVEPDPAQAHIASPLLSAAFAAGPWAGGVYGPAMAAVVGAVKEGGRHDLVDVIADHVHAAWICLDPPLGPLTLVPVPSRPAVVRRRGLDLTRTLCTSLCAREEQRRLSVRPVLRLRRRVRDQAGLTAASRAANMRGAFGCVRPARAGESVVLVDDIMTTGATATAAVAALVRAGYNVHSAVFALATPPP